MNKVEKIIEQLKSMPESDQAEVLDFLEYLKSKKRHKEEDSEWSRFSLDSAMRGIEEEPAPYRIKDIKEKFSVSRKGKLCCFVFLLRIKKRQNYDPH